MRQIFTKPWLYLAIIIILAIWLRLYQFNAPLADWHSWRQADTSSVSRYYLKNGLNLLQPRFDDLSNIPSGKDNPEGYRFVEFPIYNFFVYLTAHNSTLNIEESGRLVSIICSVLTIILLFFLVRFFLDDRLSILTSLFYAVLPYNIYYGRVILPEPMLVLTGVGMVYFYCRWIDRPRHLLFLLLGLILGAVAFLIKPFIGVYLFPVLYFAYKRWNFRLSLWLAFGAALILTIAPFFAWRLWIAQYPSGIPASDLLFNENNIRFKGAFFYWLFAERLAKLILGYWGVFFLMLGLVTKPLNKAGYFFHFWFLGIITYLTIIAAGNVRHDYYQIITTPIICILLAIGANYLISKPVNLNNWLAKLGVIVVFLFMLAFSWYQIRDFFLIIHPEIVEAGQAVNQLTPPDSKVIAPYFGDTAFLYQTQRQGWPMMTNSLPQLISKGANYYVSVKFDPETTQIMQQYSVVKQTNNYVIIKLTPK